MTVRRASPAEQPQLLALMESAMRPDGGSTRVRDDFPVALGQGNGQGLLVLAQDDVIAAGLACLVRPFRTSLGQVTVAAIGNVVTHPRMRGRGHSSRLQAATLDMLKAQGVALAVLWSDHPEWYVGRGFLPAGVEYHVNLTGWRPPDRENPTVTLRAFRPGDEAAVTRVHESHPYITMRQPGDASLLYKMPGTGGWLACDARGKVVAYVFCGKGADFPGYVLEWGGAWPGLQKLLTAVKTQSLAQRILVPQGCEEVRRRLLQQGAESLAVPSGLWCVVSPEFLLAQTAEQSRETELPAADQVGDVAAWLGKVGPDGRSCPGPLELAVWGFDSV